MVCFILYNEYEKTYCGFSASNKLLPALNPRQTERAIQDNKLFREKKRNTTLFI